MPIAKAGGRAAGHQQRGILTRSPNPKLDKILRVGSALRRVGERGPWTAIIVLLAPPRRSVIGSHSLLKSMEMTGVSGLRTLQILFMLSNKINSDFFIYPIPSRYRIKIRNVLHPSDSFSCAFLTEVYGKSWPILGSY